jgi:hypothetical protein
MPESPQTGDVLPLAPQQIEQWRERVKRAEQRQKDYHKWWDKALSNYAPSVKETPESYQLKIRTNRAFTIVERKGASLFYRRPEVTVVPSPMLDSVPDGAAMASAHAGIINEKLGVDGVDAKALARDVIFDWELFGAGWCKLFYQSFTAPTERETSPAIVDPISGAEIAPAVMETVDVPIKGECGIEAYSPRQQLIPADFHSTRFDKAPWLGVRFQMPLAEAKRRWKDRIREDFQGSDKGGEESEQRFDHGASGDGPKVDMVSGTEIHYRSYLFREDIAHPDHLTRIVFIDGIKEPVEHRNSPDQDIITPEWIAELPEAREMHRARIGALTPDSLIGYPYHPLVIRTLTDSAYVMSDVAVALPLTQELDKSREQRVIQRDINLTKGYYNTSKFSPEDVDKAAKAAQGGLVGLPPEAFEGPKVGIEWQEHSTYPPDNDRADAIIDNDLSRTFGIDGTTSGTADPSVNTATEASLRQANVNERLGWEQSFVADWYVKLVTKFSTLVQRYLSVEDAALIVGQEAAVAWDQWRKRVPARIAFSILPDSSLRNDTPLDRKQLMDLFTYLANDPTLNRPYLVERLLLRYHLDPQKAILPKEQWPQPQPPEPKLPFSFGLNGEDMSPLSPQSPIAVEVLSQALQKIGIQIHPDTIKAAMALGAVAQMRAVQDASVEHGQKMASKGIPPHGGKLPQVESLDKHAAQETGGMQNSGALVPGMAGGAPSGGVQ